MPRDPGAHRRCDDYIVRRQIESGIDVGNDGEMPRSTFGHIIERMSGWRSLESPTDPRHAALPKWWQNFQAQRAPANVYGFRGDGPVRYESLTAPGPGCFARWAPDATSPRPS